MRKHARYLLKKYGIKPKQNLDQYFFVDEKTIRSMIELAGIKKQSRVLEIGSGLGFLTRQIAEKAGEVIAVEIDQKLVEILKREYNFGNVKIINKNALKIKKIGEKCDLLISSLPYSICEPIFHLMFHSPPKKAVLVVPKRFALRLVGRNDSYSTFSLLARAFLNTKIIKDVPPQSFYPQPKIISSLIVVEPRKINKEKDRKAFIVRSLYLQEDKKVKNALRKIILDLGIKKTRREATELIKSLRIPNHLSNKKVEHISLEEYLKLVSVITKAGN